MKDLEVQARLTQRTLTAVSVAVVFFALAPHRGDDIRSALKEISEIEALLSDKATLSKVMHEEARKTITGDSELTAFVESIGLRQESAGDVVAYFVHVPDETDRLEWVLRTFRSAMVLEPLDSAENKKVQEAIRAQVSSVAPGSRTIEFRPAGSRDDPDACEENLEVALTRYLTQTSARDLGEAHVFVGTNAVQLDGNDAFIAHRMAPMRIVPADSSRLPNATEVEADVSAYWDEIRTKPAAGAKRYLENELKEAIGSIALLGTSVDGRFAVIGAPAVCIVLLLLLRVHITHIRLNRGDVNEVAWIVLFQDPLARSLSCLSIAVLPTVACALLFRVGFDDRFLVQWQFWVASVLLIWCLVVGVVTSRDAFKIASSANNVRPQQPVDAAD